jgi:ribosomal protein S18 acetylase RimI-like enzyme
MIRQLTLDDIAVFAAMRAEMMRANPESFGSPEEQQGGEAMMDAYRQWLSGHLYGAFEKDRLVGVTGFYVPQDARQRHRAMLFSVYVTKTCRGKGYGDALVKRAIEEASGLAEQIHLQVVTTSQAAIDLYKRNGFEIYGTDPRVFKQGNAFWDEYLMVKKFK